MTNALVARIGWEAYVWFQFSFSITTVYSHPNNVRYECVLVGPLFCEHSSFNINTSWFSFLLCLRSIYLSLYLPPSPSLALFLSPLAPGIGRESGKRSFKLRISKYSVVPLPFPASGRRRKRKERHVIRRCSEGGLELSRYRRAVPDVRSPMYIYFRSCLLEREIPRRTPTNARRYRLARFAKLSVAKISYWKRHVVSMGSIFDGHLMRFPYCESKIEIFSSHTLKKIAC